jgi:chromosome segregation ATPase
MPVRKLTYTILAERLKCSLEAVRSLVTGEVATLKVRIQALQTKLAKLEATAASHRADYERERDRADRLLTELLKANANITGAMAAKLEGEIAAMRLAAEAGAGADVMVARASLDGLTIEVGEVGSASAGRGSHRIAWPAASARM